jgi:hypothetical protein
MLTNTKRTHVVIPEQLVKEIRQLKSLDASAGAWKDSDHPELNAGSARWVKKVRQENERRFQK